MPASISGSGRVKMLIACWATLWIALVACQAMAESEAPVVIAEHDEVKPAAVEEIVHAAEPITVDGKLDDPVWKKANKVVANFELESVGKRSPEEHLIARFAWDEHYFYIGYEVFDTDLRAQADGRTKGPKESPRTCSQAWAPKKKVDLAEFFISTGDLRVMWEVQHNAMNHFNDVLDIACDEDWPISKTNLPLLRVIMCQDEYIRNTGDKTVRWAVRAMRTPSGKPSTVNGLNDTDVGYTGEIRLPWAGIGVPKDARKENGGYDMAGREITLFIATLNGNDGPRYWHSSPNRKPGGMFATSSKYFPKYKLAE